MGQYGQHTNWQANTSAFEYGLPAHILVAELKLGAQLSEQDVSWARQAMPTADSDRKIWKPKVAAGGQEAGQLSVTRS